jgi:hypothetical protein
MMLSQEPRVLALFASGFRGTCSTAAVQLRMAKPTIYKHVRALESRGIVTVVDTCGDADIWALTRGGDADVVRSDENVGMVARALASRPALHLWAIGELR